nr:immunoglobulin heavy chain junction region [Mus musculus]
CARNYYGSSYGFAYW